MLCELSVLQFDKRIIRLRFFLIILKMASNKVDDIYKMTTNPRGFCVIFNMLNFDGNNYKKFSLDKIEYLTKSKFTKSNTYCNMTLLHLVAKTVVKNYSSYF